MRLYKTARGILILGVICLGACGEEQVPGTHADSASGGHDSSQGDAVDRAAVDQAAVDQAAVDRAVADSAGEALICGGKNCNDGLSCTKDLCLASGCSNQLLPGHCLIDKACYKDQQQKGSGSCQRCDSASSTSAWTDDVSLCSDDGLGCTTTTCASGACQNSLSSGYCLVAGSCVLQGAADPKNGCRVCDVTKSTSSFQSKSNGSSCSDDGLSCTTDSCQAGVCSHKLKSGYCKLNGACYYQNEINPQNACQYCKPAVATAWSHRPDGAKCTEDGLSCTDDVCKAGACVNLPKAGHCLIGGSCFASGKTSPTAECRRCDPKLSTSAWSNKPTGSSCSPDKLGCTNDVCQGGACSHKLKAGHCLIGGSCLAKGAAHPSKACHGCNPAKSTSTWAVLSDGSSCSSDGISCTSDVCKAGACTHTLTSGYCLINGTCHGSGAKSPQNSCQRCDPASSSNSWAMAADDTPCESDGASCTDDVCKSGACTHSLANNSCLIGGQCHGAGKQQPGNACRICIPASAPSSWSTAANGSPCSGGSCLGGSCCQGCVSGGSCQGGTSPSACGKAGGPCSSCATGSGCVGGSCVLSSWKYRRAVSISSGSARSYYQVLLRLTPGNFSYASAQPGGIDLRFSTSPSAGTSFNLSHWIEQWSHYGTSKVWVRVPYIPAGSSAIYLYYGRPTAPSTSNLNSTFPSRYVSSGNTTLGGTRNYDWFEIRGGHTLFLQAGQVLRVNARRILIHGIVNGEGRGHAGGSSQGSGAGPGGGGGSSDSGGGGGAHGGKGGRGGHDSGDTPGAGGYPNGSSSSTSIDLGSGGGAAASSGGAGGGAIWLEAEELVVDGLFSVSGLAGGGSSQSGGGGAGGGILLRGGTVTLQGSISARGGDGGSGSSTANDGGGGGGGGRFKVFYQNSYSNNASVSVGGGAGGTFGDADHGQPGGSGSYWIGKQSFGLPTVSVGPEVSL